MGGGLPPNPSAFFKDRNVFSDKKANFPLSEATKTCTQGLLPHKKKKPHENDLGALSREDRPSSSHTALAGAICALHSEFFTSEPLKSGLCCPQAILLWGLRRACNSGDGRLWTRRIVVRSFWECSEQLGVL